MSIENFALFDAATEYCESLGVSNEELRKYEASKLGPPANGIGYSEHEKMLILTANKGYILSFARGFKSIYDETADKIQNATVGFLLGLDRFDWTRGVSFSTYVYPNMNYYMLSTYRKLNAIPMDMISLDGDFQSDPEEYDPLDSIIAHYLQSTDQNDSVENNVLRKVSWAKLKDALADLKKSNPKNYSILCMKYGFDGYKVKSEKEMAALFGVSQPAISKSLSKANAFLKDILKSKYHIESLNEFF